MLIDRSFWRNKRVLVTGHAGFKGTWLCEWLTKIGADVIGFGRSTPRHPSIFDMLELDHRIDSIIGDIRDRDLLQRTCERRQPEIIMHLAAQPLVRLGLEQPQDTFETNVQGSVNVMEAARSSKALQAMMIVTSDKCYEPSNDPRVENDRLGGKDPYSASKACTELAAASFTKSFFGDGQVVGIATARAGNVLGGGDMGKDRLLPDLVQALLRDGDAKIRFPDAIRPWQHVLDALHGYILLVQSLALLPAHYTGPWNFGPDGREEWTVAQIADEIVAQLGAGRWHQSQEGPSLETKTLRLTSTKSQQELGWAPKLDIRDTIAWTIEGYRSLFTDQDVSWIPRQIDRFEQLPLPVIDPQAKPEVFNAVA